MIQSAYQLSVFLCLLFVSIISQDVRFLAHKIEAQVMYMTAIAGRLCNTVQG